MDGKKGNRKQAQQQQHYNPGSDPLFIILTKPFLESSWAGPRQVSLLAGECTSRAVRFLPHRNKLPPIAAFHKPLCCAGR